MGSGRAPFAPGTFGSLTGVAFFVFLVATGQPLVYLLGTLAGVAASVWFCGEAEKILGQTDPGSVVLDEIIAMPISFGGWVLHHWLVRGGLPEPGWFFTGPALGYSVAVFVLFRILDIAKPWPIEPLQRLPGGWGVTADDVAAALVVAVISFFFPV